MKHRPRLAPVATRTLKRTDGGRTRVVVSIGRPYKRTRFEWACPYHIVGVGMRKGREALGVDAVQALILALKGLRADLDTHGRKLAWFPEHPGDTGIPVFVTSAYGPAATRRLERVLERATRAESVDMMRRAKHRRR